MTGTNLTPRLVKFTALLLLLPAPSLFAQDEQNQLRVLAGKSLVIDYPEDVSRISTSNPEVIDYVPVSNREILLHARGAGIATLVVWSKAGHRNFYNITVEQNLESVRELLVKTFPGEELHVQAARESITLTGRASSKAVADQAVALLIPIAKSVVNHLDIQAEPVEKQILLRVKFAELNRSAAQSFGVNLLSTGGLNTPGLISTGQFTAGRPSELRGTIGGQLPGTESTFSIADALNIFAFRPDLNLAVAIKALQSKGLLQILAEPNLVTSNGKEASFLVGGEFPVPIVQGGVNAGAVTVQFREFGIRLTFNPQLTRNGTLKMFVRPEVSTIDIANAVSVGGFTIPALATRRIESTIELGPGQSFVIGGLIDDRANESFSRIPGLSSIPVLGALFRSRNENRTKTELIVMVTPETVEPLQPNDPRVQTNLPMDTLRPSLLPGGVPSSATETLPAGGARTREELFEKALPKSRER